MLGSVSTTHGRSVMPTLDSSIPGLANSDAYSVPIRCHDSRVCSGQAFKQQEVELTVECSHDAILIDDLDSFKKSSDFYEYE